MTWVKSWLKICYNKSMYNTIIEKVVTALSTITGIKAVYDYEAPNYEKYPCAVIIPLGRNSIFKTIGRDNERRYRFQVRLVHKIESSQTDQKQLRTLADAVDNLFESQSRLDLGGSVNYTIPAEGAFKFITGEVGLYVYEFVLEASYLFARQ